MKNREKKEHEWSVCFAIAAIYVAFYGLVGLSVWWTRTIWPLFFLLLTPRVKYDPVKRDPVRHTQ